MKLSFREALADSHVSAVAIALLLFRSLSWVVGAFSWPFLRLVDFLATAVAIRHVPFISPKLDVADRYMLVNACFFFLNAAIALVAALILSRWVYGEGPLRSLRGYRERLARRSHV